MVFMSNTSMDKEKTLLFMVLNVLPGFYIGWVLLLSEHCAITPQYRTTFAGWPGNLCYPDKCSPLCTVTTCYPHLLVSTDDYVCKIVLKSCNVRKVKFNFFDLTLFKDHTGLSERLITSNIKRDFIIVHGFKASLCRSSWIKLSGAKVSGEQIWSIFLSSYLTF